MNEERARGATHCDNATHVNLSAIAQMGIGTRVNVLSELSVQPACSPSQKWIRNLSHQQLYPTLPHRTLSAMLVHSSVFSVSQRRIANVSDDAFLRLVGAVLNVSCVRVRVHEIIQLGQIVQLQDTRSHVHHIYTAAVVRGRQQCVCCTLNSAIHPSPCGDEFSSSGSSSKASFTAVITPEAGA